MLVLPRTAEYALRAVSFIAEHEGTGPVPVSEIADALGAPRNYLSKTLHRLGAMGVLRSVRGVRGGYCLGQPPEECRLADIVEPFLAEAEHHCIMGHLRCSEDAPCGAHQRWMEVRRAAQSFFSELSMADLLTPPVTGSTTINELLLRHSRTASVLNRLGIDACCGGGETLEQAARSAGLSVSQLLSELGPALEAA